MYPVDLLKVCKGHMGRYGALQLNHGSDSNANHQPHRWWSLYGLVKRRVYYIPNRGSTNALERGFQCHRRCWWAAP